MSVTGIHTGSAAVCHYVRSTNSSQQHQSTLWLIHLEPGAYLGLRLFKWDEEIQNAATTSISPPLLQLCSSPLQPRTCPAPPLLQPRSTLLLPRSCPAPAPLQPAPSPLQPRSSPAPVPLLSRSAPLQPRSSPAPAPLLSRSSIKLQQPHLSSATQYCLRRNTRV
ncbi:hypothetical protein JZ751_015746 [Albula glossodonta]|uniref:Uncharacterized protein n=1 Tax=Albula glossodonta TaxID=121402 RepID=A0A8T2MIT4_9TELE|nr:hypothetical protein JZ751_015746 [Albula glossodonta]